MIKKFTTCSAMLILLMALISACSSATPTSNSVNLPNVKNDSGATATTASGAYPPSASTQKPAVSNTQTAPTDSPYPFPPNFTLSVIKPDGTKKALASTDLMEIPTRSITAGTKVMIGIPVISILNISGITDFKQITFSDANGASQVLSKDKVDSSVILAIISDGTLQLVSPNMPEDQWLKSVISLKVE